MGAARIFRAAVLVCAIAASARPEAIERMRLPVFQLTASDGRVMTTGEIVKAGRWLMIYVQPDCPRCVSARVSLTSEFGSTPCKSLYRCLDCLEPFDHFKCH